MELSLGHDEALEVEVDLDDKKQPGNKDESPSLIFEVQKA